jgi:allophanate hydrolase subunit 2
VNEANAIEAIEAIEVLAAGARTSIVRATRGQAHLGMSVGGPFDVRAALRANRLVGNRDDAAVLEMTLVGPTLRFVEDARVAVVGALARAGVHDVNAGDVLALGNCTHGARAYLAIAGGFVLGEVAKGAPLTRRDVAGRRLPAPTWALPDDVVLRVTDAPHSAAFADALAALVARTWRVSPTSDRAGVRLEGPTLPAQRAAEMTSVGVSVGAVQLPPSGQPTILGVDRATTGGYPVIAHVATVDRWLLGQLRPGAPLRFTPVSFAEARALARSAVHHGVHDET